MARGAAQSKTDIQPIAHAPRGDEAWVPLHPMHRRLVAEMGDAAFADEPLSRPARFAALFYVGLAGWATVALGAWGISALI